VQAAAASACSPKIGFEIVAQNFLTRNIRKWRISLFVFCGFAKIVAGDTVIFIFMQLYSPNCFFRKKCMEYVLLEIQIQLCLMYRTEPRGRWEGGEG
jgi:hypothetical protein